MRAVVPVETIPRPDLVENFKFRSGVAQALSVGMFESECAKTIDDTVDFHSGPGALGKSFDELVAQLTGAPDEVFECDGIGGAANRFEHRWENFMAIN